MKKLLYVFIVFAFLTGGMVTPLVASGLAGWAKDTAKTEMVNRLIAEAKLSDPELAKKLEMMLAGTSLMTSPAATLEGVFPSSIALSGITQLIDKHWPDISRMSYSDRKVWVEGGDDSMIPEDDTEKKPDPLVELCSSMLEPRDAQLCVNKMKRIYQCNALKGKTDAESKKLLENLRDGCDEDALAIYELMEHDGKTDDVKKAGALGGQYYSEGMQYFSTKGNTKEAKENSVAFMLDLENKMRAAFKDGDNGEVSRLGKLRRRVKKEYEQKQ